MRPIPWIAFGLLLASMAHASGTGVMTQAEAERAVLRGTPPTMVPERHVVLMPVVGMWTHPFEQTGWNAKAGPLWGLDVKIEPFRWLGVRASFLRGNQPIGLDANAPRPAGTDEIYQPILQITHLQLRAEPTLHLSRDFSTYLGLGMGWGRVVAPETVTVPRWHSLDRSGVYLAYEAALGMAYEPLPDHIVLDLSFGGAMLADESGTAFESAQAFSDAGHRETLLGSAPFAAAYRAMFGVGLVL